MEKLENSDSSANPAVGERKATGVEERRLFDASREQRNFPLQPGWVQATWRAPQSTPDEVLSSKLMPRPQRDVTFVVVKHAGSLCDSPCQTRQTHVLWT
eukprot:1155833-Pelagomonas_calceolata.AAC.6